MDARGARGRCVELRVAHAGRRSRRVYRGIQGQALLVVRSQHVAEQVVFGHLVLLKGIVVHRLLVNLSGAGRVHADISAGSRWPAPVARIHIHFLIV